ncbi:hypothetical protein CROQUDRAFT_651567 [Cronartium quercuum f. sp. fusiforme G11]|uniref:Uncharacterized protein n=1 Tax=Cronartium quercuum f. sp. fusiforme G11 TaxID=708437 RepID=A0A9P6NSY7_9BASI|nr:hypothetical protein CROQUDRAFT_651567 [Cronartium quercuum f. sp. fusiforme G11]
MEGIAVAIGGNKGVRWVLSRGSTFPPLSLDVSPVTPCEVDQVSVAQDDVPGGLGRASFFFWLGVGGQIPTSSLSLGSAGASGFQGEGMKQVRVWFG